MISDLKNVLLNCHKSEMILYLRTNPNSIKEAVALALSEEQPLAWRAAWLLSGSMAENDSRFHTYTGAILSSLKNRKDGHQRELIKILLNLDINEEYEGLLFDICMNIWEQIGKNPSVRVMAFRFILKMAEKYPEISNEIQFITQKHYLETLSPGVQRSVEKLLQKHKITSKTARK